MCSQKAQSARNGWNDGQTASHIWSGNLKYKTWLENLVGNLQRCWNFIAVLEVHQSTNIKRVFFQTVPPKKMGSTKVNHVGNFRHFRYYYSWLSKRKYHPSVCCTFLTRYAFQLVSLSLASSLMQKFSTLLKILQWQHQKYQEIVAKCNLTTVI